MQNPKGLKRAPMISGCRNRARPKFDVVAAHLFIKSGRATGTEFQAWRLALGLYPLRSYRPMRSNEAEPLRPVETPPQSAAIGRVCGRMVP